MNRALFPVVLALLAASSARAQESPAALASAELPSLVAMYKRLHASPELSTREAKTSAFVAKELAAAGYRVAYPFGDYRIPGRTAYGVVAVMKNGAGPTVLLRADMDALPVEEKTGLPYASAVRAKDLSGETVPVMHACGHDLHTTTLIGAARVLAKLKERWKGTLVLVAQPAEEFGDGAKAMLDGGLYAKFPKPDFLFALHDTPEQPAGQIGYKPGYALASIDTLELLVKGKGGHGAWPQNAKDPIVLAAQIVLALQTVVSREVPALEAAVLTVGSIHGGTRANLIPNEVRLQITLRTFKEELRTKLLAAIQRVANGQAASAGLPESMYPVLSRTEEPTPTTYNDPALMKRLLPVFASQIGAENVQETDAHMGGEDFSRYSLDHAIPSAMFWIGAVDPKTFAQAKETGAPLPPLHSSLFAPAPEAALRVSVPAMTAAALELLAGKR